jgi:hypothetical protein
MTPPLWCMRGAFVVDREHGRAQGDLVTLDGRRWLLTRCRACGLEAPHGLRRTCRGGVGHQDKCRACKNADNRTIYHPRRKAQRSP